MSAPYIIPFNFQPISTEVKNASYTIPSGKYAYIFDSAGDLAINAAPVVRSYGNSASVTYVSPNTFTHLPNTLMRVDWSINGSGVDTFSITGYGTFGRSDGVTSSGTFYFFPPPGQTAATVAAVSTNDTLSFTATTYLRFEQQIWVKSGDVITGQKFWVTLYNQIS